MLHSTYLNHHENPSEDHRQKGGAIYSLVSIGVMAALTCVLSILQIPIGPVPITLSVLAILLCVYVLGATGGTAAVFIYLLLGLAGLPVLAGGTAGPAKLLGPTGGFLIGYIPFSLISGLLIDLASSKKITRKSTSILLQIGGMVLGLLVLYVFGTIWFLFRYAESTSFFAALKLCVIPFIPFDLLKILIAYFLGSTLRARLMQAGYLP